MITYDEKFVNGRMSLPQKLRLLQQGDANRNPPKNLKQATIEDLRVGLCLYHYTNCGNLWSHIIRSREEEPNTELGSKTYELYKEYIKQGIRANQYFIKDEQVYSKSTSIKSRKRSQVP